MKLQVSSNDFEMTPAIREYLSAKLEKMGKFFQRLGPNPLFEVSVSRIAHRRRGEHLELVLNLHLPKKTLRSQEKGSDIYVLIDAVEAEAIRLLKEEKEKSLAKARESARRMKGFA